MRRILSFLLAVSMVLGVSAPCYAAEGAGDTQDVYVKYIRESVKNEIPVENGGGTVVTENGYTVTVTGAPEHAAYICVLPIPSTETSAWAWFAECIGNDSITAVFDICFVDAQGNRINADGAAVTLTPASKPLSVYAVSTDGDAAVMESASTGDGIGFSANGSHYYVLAELPREALEIITQPMSANILADETVRFAVEAAGTDVTYQWQYRSSASGSWKATTVTGNRTDTITVTGTTGRDGYQYRCRITDAEGSELYSDAVTLRVTGIKTQPESQSILVGKTTDIVVAATGADLRYQWQYRKNDTDSWKSTTLSGNKTDTLTVSGTTGRDGYQYRCQITDGEGNILYSKGATLRVTGIKDQPESRHILAGEACSFHVEATGEGLYYQWQYRKHDADTWKTTTVSGNKTDTLTVEGTTVRDNYQYRCKITDGEGNELYSDAVTLRVLGIKTQPESKSIVVNDTVSFSVKATGDSLAYQWQYRKNEADTWKTTTVSGSKTDTITVNGTTGRDGYQYRCKMTDSVGNVLYSEGVTLRVTGIKTQPESRNILAGETVSFSVSATGENLTYQWQYRKSSTGVWQTTTVEGNKTDTITVSGTTARDNYQYRCKISDGEGNVIYSEGVTLRVTGIKTQPASYSGKVGDQAVFKVVATGEGLTYLWQYRSTPNGTWKTTTQSGYKTATLTIPVANSRNNYQYRCKITDADGKVIYSDAAVLTLGGIAITEQPENQNIAVNEVTTFRVAAVGTDLTYQWQYRKNDSDSWKTTTVSGNKTAVLTVEGTTVRDGYQYRCKVTDGEGNTVYSEGATLRVTGIKTQPVSKSVTVGQKVVFSVTATGEGLTYLWQYRSTPSGSWKTTTQSGYKTNALTITATTARNGYQYRCCVTDAEGNVVYSNGATLTVK